MSIERKPTRYAHSDGHTDVCYSEDGSKLISCGTDGDIRIWSGFEDDDPIQTCVGEWSLCVRQKGEHLQIATDNNNVQLVTFPEGERDGILMRFTAPVNHMAVGKSHNYIAIGAEDMEVKVVDISNVKGENATKVFSGLAGPPLSVCLCPKAKMLAVSAGDGLLRIWDVESQSLLKEFNCVPKVNSFMNAKTLCRMDFDPVHARYLAYPDNNSVIIVNTSDWSKKQTLSCNAIEATYSIVQFSPCGMFLAAATVQGDIIVWDVVNGMLVDSTIHPKSVAICAMVWNPKGNGEIAFCDTEGQLGIVLNCSNNDEVEEAPTTLEEQLEGEDDNEGIDFGDVGLQDDDEDNENAVSLEKLKNEIMGTGDGTEKDADERSISLPPSSRPRTPEIPLQAPFMPTSTPEHLNPRYMCWNEVAVIRCYGSGDDDAETGKSIEVEFHDSTFHNSVMLPNFQNYTMGTVSTSSLVVANVNQMRVVPLSSGTKEWNITVEEDEEIICVACSSNLVCVATNNYLVRVFTTYGIQKAVFSVPGPLVSMTAFACFALIAYHSASARKSDQCISMMLIKLEGTSVDSRPLQSALSPEATLHWIGFTDMGNPASMDTYGMLNIFPLKSNLWIPFCDTTKKRNSPLDGFFVTAVYESLNTVRGIKCRGGMYPGFTPRPTQSELELQPPFLEIGTEKSELEANMFMWSTLQVDNTEKKHKETALKSFALACKNGLDQRAIELIEMLGNSQVLALAVKYASKLDKRRMVEKLMELASKLETEDENEETDAAENTQVITPTVMKPINRKLVLSSKITPKSKNSSLLNSTPTNSKGAVSRNLDDTQTTPDCSKLNDTSTSINTQDTTLSEDEPKNPFLKNLKKPKNPTYNPLSLTDKFAGFNVEKKNKNSPKEATDKRKQPDSDSSEGDKQKEKQRRLDKFMFSKRN